MNNGKPLILDLEFLDEATYNGIRRAFEEQYNIDLRDLDDQFWFLAISNDVGDMWEEHYRDNPDWKRTNLGEWQR